MTPHSELKVSVSNKAIIKLAAPISLAMALPQISIFANNVFVGRLGDLQLAVNGIAGIYYLILSMIGYGFSCGAQVQFARRAGEADTKALGQTFVNSIALGAVLSAILIIAGDVLAPRIFSFSMNDSATIALSIRYTKVRVWGLPFLLISQCVSAFFISTGRSKVLIYGALAAMLTNVAFDYMLIYGHAGFLPMGLQGAAVSSIISEFVLCAVMVSAVFLSHLYKKYNLASHARIDIPLCRHILKVSLPLIVQFMFSIGGWMIFFFFVEHLGTRSLAASQILRSLFGIVGVGTWALGTACNTMVSNIIGQGKQSSVIPLMWKIARLSVAFAAIVGALLCIFSHAFLSIYTRDEGLIQLAIPSLRVIVSATVLMGLATVVFNTVVGSGNTMVNLTLEVICVGSYLTYCYVVIRPAHIPLYVAWGAEFVYWSMLFLCSYFYLLTGRWRGKRI